MPHTQVATPEARLLARRKIDPISNCWIWMGARSKTGYGWIGIGSRTNHSTTCVHAHRLAAHLWLGLDLTRTDIHALHHCDNRACFNPDHLFLGSNADNVADRHTKGRTNPGRGEKVWTAKLTAEQVVQMRTMKAQTGQTDKEIGRAFGVTQAMASRIISRRAWTHIQ